MYENTAACRSTLHVPRAQRADRSERGKGAQQRGDADFGPIAREAAAVRELSDAALA